MTPGSGLRAPGSGLRRRERHAHPDHVGVDCRLVRRRHPTIALINALRLGRHLKFTPKNSLTDLNAQLLLTSQVGRLAAGSQPHRAPWDTS
jgi:DNA polymerase III subunit epsilon